VHTPDLYKFNVRVAYAIPVPGSAQLDYQVWTEGWTVALAGSKTTSFWRLKDTFRSVFQAQSIPYFEQMTKPDPYGHWMLATNHLDVKKPAPQLWTVWEGDFTIADIVTLQDYKLPKGMNCYPVTLIYYPKQQDPDTLTERSWSIALGDDELLGPDLPELPVATETTVNVEASCGHKRTISAVTSRAEREVEREEAAEVADTTQEVNDNDINVENAGGATGGTVRRSGRALKPVKRRWGRIIDGVEVFNNLNTTQVYTRMQAFL
jgi:hypothetical protein